MTEHNCRGKLKAEDPVSLAAYTIDSHNCQRLVKGGRAENEGDVQVGGFPPYPISYRAIVPKAGECDNLLVPICLSATHIACGSIRMEPVFMILGQSAATAAALAINENVSVQKVDYQKLRARLLADQQVLEWKSSPGRPAGAGYPRPLRRIVVDDADATKVGGSGRLREPWLGCAWQWLRGRRRRGISASEVARQSRRLIYFSLELLSLIFSRDVWPGANLILFSTMLPDSTQTIC
jgi:hypothetical protein